jgi:NAD(P)-dependent dehydrogenase (short-subunit alcohol dehydrogenase family)
MIVRRMPSFLELAPIRVNVFSPGLTATPTWSGMSEGNRETMFGNAARICQRAAWGGARRHGECIFLAKTPFASASTVKVDAAGPSLTVGS